MKKVMIFGTFDIFHKGHISFIKQARKYGDELTVVIARDRNVAKIKGKAPLNNELNRKKTIEASGLADKVLLGDLEDSYKSIKQLRPAIICLGYDQKSYTGDLREKLDGFGMPETGIVRLKPYHPDKYKSSKLK